MDLDDFDPPMAEDILDGMQTIDLSHAGGEFFELISEDMKKPYGFLIGDYAFANIVLGVICRRMQVTGGIG
jgi:hypothetical protein